MNSLFFERFNREVSLACECANSYVEIDPYFEIFEASDPEVSNQSDNNKKSKNGFFDHISKAIEMLVNGIKKLINRVKNFFFHKDYDKSINETKRRFLLFKKKNPSKANGRINTLDVNKFNSSCNSLLAEAEDASSKLAAGQDLSISGIVSKINSFCNSGLGAFSTSIGMEAALQMASSSKEIASLMSQELEKDGIIEDGLKKQIGEKQYNKFKKDVNSLSKNVSLRGAILKLRGYKAKSVEDGVKSTINQIKNLLGDTEEFVGVVGTAPNKDSNKSKFGNKMAKAKHFASNSGEMISAGSDFIKNRGDRILKRVAGNSDIKNAGETYKYISSSLSKAKKAEEKERNKFIKDKKKKVKELRNLSKQGFGHNDKSKQSAMSALRGDFDPNAKLFKRNQ